MSIPESLPDDVYDRVMMSLYEHGVPACRKAAKGLVLSYLYGGLLTARDTFIVSQEVEALCTRPGMGWVRMVDAAMPDVRKAARTTNCERQG